NKAIVRRFYEQLDGGNLAIIDSLVATNFIGHYPGGQDIHGPEGLKELGATFYSAFPDLQHAIEDIAADGDRIVARYTIRGTHKAELLGVAPTNKQVMFTAIAIYRLADGKLVEDWVEYDALGLMQQLGAIPELGQPKAEEST
ncbi:MAG: ester cyclase, partial [bacterium]|nr:ester cyclase [bacterium]